MRTHFGRYAVVRQLGMGAFGEVYLARDPELARDVAVKALRSEALSRDSMDILLREARAVASLQHPALVTVYDVGSDDETSWVVMEYVPGETLRHRMDRGPLPLAEVVRIGGALAGALIMAHSNGVLHRDIKPANVLLTPQGDAKLADFGMAHTSVERTIAESGTVVGTLLYMSPQQAMGEKVDERADLFSLGVVLYEALVGVHPFVRDSDVATLYAVLNEPPTPPPAGGPPFPPAARAFFQRAMNKEPSGRHPDALAFADDLISLLDPARSATADTTKSGERGRFESRLVGRDAEFQKLRDRLLRVRAGEGGAVLLAGEAGIGKTRILAELSRAAEEQNIRVLRGRSLIEGGPAYHSWQQILAQAIDGSPRGVAAGFQEFLTAHPEFAGSREACLRRLLRLDEREADDLSGPDQIWDAAVAALQTLASERPLLVVLDDLHWADPSTLKMFHFAAAQAQGRKWLLIGAYRSEEAEGDAGASLAEVARLMGREEGVETVHLGRLDPSATSAMVDELLGEEVAATAIERRIFTETEGNPLFIVEVAKMVAESGGRLEDVAIPARVVDVVEHRLDRLSVQERDALEVAAVEGEYFHVAPIAAVLELTRIKALKLMQGLERRHQIVRPAEQRFRFDHAKIREVILTRLALPLRREYHGIVATCLQEEPGSVSSALLAHHLTEAGDPAGALPHRLRAAAEARAVFANEEALHHLAQALTTLLASPDTPDVQRQRGEVRLDTAKILQRTGSFQSGAALFAEVAAMPAVPGGERQAGRAWFGEGECEFALARYDMAQARFDQAREAAERTGDASLLSRIHVATGRVHGRRGEFDQALAACARAEVLARELGDERARALARLESGDICFRRGDLRLAGEHMHSALTIAERNQDLPLQAGALGAMATVAREAGDFAAALDRLERARALCRRMGDVQGEARFVANQGNVYLNRGQSTEARRCYEPALRSFRALGSRHAEAVVLSNMILALAGSGDYEAAAHVATDSLALARELGDRWELAGTLDNLGALQHRRGRSAEARRILRDAVRLQRELGARARLVDTLMSLAQVEIALVDRENALPHAREALADAEGDEEISVARGILALCGGVEGNAAMREAADGLLRAAHQARDREDPDLETARALPASELMIRTGDWTGLEALARDLIARGATSQLRYEEACGHDRLARALWALGRREESRAEAATALRLASESDLRGIHWRTSAWLEKTAGESEPQLAVDAAASLVQFLETFEVPDERSAFVEAAGIRARVSGWRDRALPHLQELLQAIG